MAFGCLWLGPDPVGGSEQLPQMLVCSHPGLCKRGCSPCSPMPGPAVGRGDKPLLTGALRPPTSQPASRAHGSSGIPCSPTPVYTVQEGPSILLRLQTPIHPSRPHSLVPTSTSIPQGPLLPLFRARRMCSHHPTPSHSGRSSADLGCLLPSVVAHAGRAQSRHPGSARRRVNEQRPPPGQGAACH